MSTAQGAGTTVPAPSGLLKPRQRKSLPHNQIGGVLKMFHLKTRVEFCDDTYVDVSTIELRRTPGGLPGARTHYYETCLFSSSGRSDVVEHYTTAEDAAKGHAAWSHPRVAAYVRSNTIDDDEGYGSVKWLMDQDKVRHRATQHAE